MTTGERIKARRKELGQTADYLAEVLGVSRSTIFRYENGDIEKLPMSILEPISKALSTTPAYLMGWDDSDFVRVVGGWMAKGAIADAIGLTEFELNFLKAYRNNANDNLFTIDGEIFLKVNDDEKKFIEMIRNLSQNQQMELRGYIKRMLYEVEAADDATKQIKNA